MNVSWEQWVASFGLGTDDFRVLRRMHPAFHPHFSDIVDGFYERLFVQEEAARILRGAGVVGRLRQSLLRWLDELFLGPHDAHYRERRHLIGRAHVAVGLPEGYVFSAMTHIRTHLAQLCQQLTTPADLEPSLVVQAINKILDLDLALMASAYRTAEKYRELVESSPDMIHELDSEGRLLLVNRTELDLLGYSEEELLDEPMDKILIADDRARCREELRHVISRGSGSCDVTLLTARGTRMEAEIKAIAVPGPLESPPRIRCYVRDISSRKHAERALVEERDRAQLYLDVAEVMLVIIDREGKIQLVNRYGAEVLGASVDALVGTDWFEHIPEAEWERARESFLHVLDEPRRSACPIEIPLKTPEGRTRVIAWNHSPLRDAEGHVIGSLSSGQDITERKHADRQLMEQAALARVGEMSAMVAHEVRNPLAGISGALEIVSGHLSLESPDRRIIDEVRKRLAALNDTLGDLLHYARLRPPRVGEVDLASLLRDIESLLRNDPRFGQVEVKKDVHPLRVSGDRELLALVLQNLLLNSSQAMGQRGSIHVTNAVEGDECVLKVEDTGPGIPPEVLARVFEPFFTTKTRGTGLGLPTARRIVESHGGTISLSASPGGGTCAEVRLPLERKDPP